MLSQSQQDAVETVMEQPGLAVLSGGPGVGKTFAVAHLLKDAIATGGKSIAVAAPTGKAALRLCEQFKQHGVPANASTIHSLMGVEEVNERGFVFYHGPTRPIPCDLLVVDEFSMVSTKMANTLFSALPSRAKVVCVGDVHQLPPVEHGSPLRDMISSGVIPTAELTEVRRNSGRIVQACKEIRETGRFTASDAIDIAAGENLKHIEKTSPSLVKGLVRRMLENVPAGIDPLRDVQIIVSCNDKGELCREKLNTSIRDFLNPGGEQAKGTELRVDDKVMCNKNRGFQSCSADGWPYEEVVTFVANGEMGQISSVSDSEIVIRLDTGLYILVKGADRKLWDLAYAITVHKSQGSQWPVVIYVSDEYGGARRVGCRELVYTAISRAQTLAVTIGSFDTIRKDLRRVAIAERRTFLKEMLQEA